MLLALLVLAAMFASLLAPFGARLLRGLCGRCRSALLLASLALRVMRLTLSLMRLTLGCLRLLTRLLLRLALRVLLPRLLLLCLLLRLALRLHRSLPFGPAIVPLLRARLRWRH